MKTNLYKAAFFTLLLWPGLEAFSQGSFINLDFEHPLLPLIPGPDGKVSITNALPGWIGYIGGSPIDRVFYDDESLGAAAISLHDTNTFINILQGKYTVLLQPSFPDGTTLPAIGQTGTIPSTALSLRLYAEGIPVVSFAGQPIPLVPVGSTATYTILAGDISAFANETGELRFTGNASIDNIVFSAQSVPEPNVFGFFALGSLFAGVGLARRRMGG